MRPTSRGWKIIIIVAMLLAFSMLFSDNILTICSLLLIVLILTMLLHLMRKVDKVKRAVIEPSALNLKLVAGNEGKAFLKFRSEVEFKIDVNESWISFRPDTMRPLEMIATLSLKPMLSGIYELTSLKLRVCDSLEFFQAHLEIPIQLKLEAYPRVFPWISEALNLLEGARVGSGDAPGRRKGRGLEYLWSREYQVGDDISFIDWKATARHQKIFVKEFLEETYGSTKLIYDVRAHGPITGDECSAYFLSAVTFASKIGLPISIIIKNGNKVIVNRENLNSAEALKLAIAYIMEHYLAAKWNIYELFEPKSARILLKISKEIGSKAFMRIAELRLSEFLKRLNEVLRNDKGLIIYIGCILIDSDFVKDLAAEISNLGGDIIVLFPPKPWLDAKSLEEAYLMYQSNEKLLRALEKIRVSLMPGGFRNFLTQRH
ncbi:MAG: DUF58 domain-containing protein [Nitrososphaerota archaeon]